ncbi:hypothetical protein [Corynebacterium macclintockiae]|uniref:hypothetical protein n=1 Tax=Corynebacterium macclintockiae TaxID=2913501 RepID=UPI003EC01441
MAQGNSTADENSHHTTEQSDATQAKQSTESTGAAQSTAKKVGSSGKSGVRSSSMRYDIEGLRGLAIGLVVVFHVFVGKVSSGVDVFLLLGGIFFFWQPAAKCAEPEGVDVPAVPDPHYPATLPAARGGGC